jgi:DNA-binding protein H-NS
MLHFYSDFNSRRFWGSQMLSKKPSLATLSNEALCELRDEIVKLLNSRAEKLRKELNRLTHSALITGGEANDRKDTRKTKGSKIAPKYRGPDGTTWCGRGLKPRWLVKEMKEGKKPEDFLILPRDKGSSKNATAATRN